MLDRDKTKEQLLEEVRNFRRRILALERDYDDYKKAKDTLLASEAKYSRLVNSLQEGIWALDTEEKTTFVNNRMAEMLGYTVEEMLGKKVFDFMDERGVKLCKEKMEKRKDGVKEQHDFELIKKDGSIIYVTMEASPINDDDGNYIGGVAGVMDISERKRAENMLKLSEARYRMLYEGTPVMMHSIDAEGKLISVSDQWLKKLGYTRDEVIGKSSTEFLTEQSRVYAHEVVLPEYMRTGRCNNIEYQFVKKSGDIIDTLLSAIAERDSSGLFVRSLAVIEDITERKKAEEAIISAKDEWERTFDAVPDLVSLLDKEHHIIRANRAMADRLGSTPEKLKERLCYEVVHNTSSPPYYCPHERLLASGKEERSEFFDRNLNGYFEVRTIPVRDENGQIAGSVHIVRDITEHRKLEDQLRQAQKMEGIGTLAGGIAHDFNNVLSAIVGYGHLSLMKMSDEDPNRMNIEQILEASDKAVSLTKDLLLFSRKQPIEKKPKDINGIIQRIEKLLKRVIGEDITFNTKLSEEKLMISIDAHQFDQVLMNFATNAQAAMPQGGTFTITTEGINLDKDFTAARGLGRPGRYALINISDTGHGMDKETREKIFEPFFTTKEVGKGTGLGLAVVYGIIKQHDGYIDVYSEKGIGSTFRIYLPLIDSGEAEDKAAAIEEEQPAGGTETILIAEDDEALRKLSNSILKQSGYTVIEAVDGEDAVQKYQKNKNRVQLLLFDLVMPKMNGKEAFDEIRKMKPDMKVIFLSGYAPDIVKQKMSLVKNFQLIYKPVSPFCLLKKVREVLDS
ncbi:MAG: PAS domain S-box protein [Nitrospirae bacterium]|nr:PAS domain S-box protein [Nitrospirota bacterium]